MHLDDLALFVRIVALGTLSAAARERGVPVSQVTRALARLEVAWGVRLLHRNTHGLSLTDEGDTFLAHARRMLETADELQAELGGRRQGPGGWVRLSVSTIIAQCLIAPSLPSLYTRHPGLQLDISADDALVDMAREGIDIAIRTGAPGGDTLVARPLGQLTRGLYASPAYVQAYGLPETLAGLAGHRLIGSSSSPAMSQWILGAGPDAQGLTVKGHTRTDSTAVVMSLVEHGVGIGRIVDLVAAPMVAAGQLVPVLPEVATTAPVPVLAVMLQERHRLPKIRACIDHWAAWLQGGS